MSHSTILIPSDSTGENHPEAEAAVVASHTPVPDLVIESNPEVEPSKALLSLDHTPVSPIHAPASPDYHPESKTEPEPFMDESEEPIEDAPVAAEPLPAQVAPPPSVQITPTLPTKPTPASHVIPHDTRATARMIVRPQPTLPLGYRAALARWSAAPLSTPYPSHSSDYSASLFRSSSAVPSVPHFRPSHRRSRHVSSSSSSSSSSAFVGPSRKRCRSLTTSLLAATSTPVVLSSIPADRLPPRKRFRGSPTISYQDATVETTAKPFTPPVYRGQTVKDSVETR
ncbi:hypothetical protein Tco_1216483, partial [Tanacetum coccineum]